jgi:glycerophosphoryl diester phosphodiesterase
MVLGHRGASAAHPENTLGAYRAAREMGADGIELDVRRTLDGVLAIHHDATLPDGRVICTLRADELPPHVPDLRAALDTCRGMVVNVEIKNNPGDADYDPDEAVTHGVVALLARRAASGDAPHDVPDDVLISSFNPLTLEVVRAAAPGLPTAQLIGLLPDPAATVDAAVGAGHVAIHPWDPTVDAALVELAHAAGLRVNVWTVNDPDRLAQLAGLGIDGVCTDVPDVAVRIYSEG